MKKLSIFLAFLVFAAFTAHAQMQITGTVTSAKDGLSVPGVSVWVKSQPTIGTTTDIDGKYTLSVPSDAQILVFSFVGMKETDVPINGQSIIDVALEEDVMEMDEVIVVAYGVQRKEAKTGAVAQIKTEDIEDVPITSAEKLLQGRVAGLQLNSSTGQPGGDTDIRIRGISSINASSEPLYVVDGVAIASGNYGDMTSTGNILSTMNPGDIASITVLKDASASSIYGSRAANGVILITTKSGKKGDVKFDIKGKMGWSTIANDQGYGIMTADEIYQYNRAALVNSGFDPVTYKDNAYGVGFYASETLPSDVETFDWYDAALNDALYQEYQFSAHGGNESTSFYTSGAYMDQEGIMIGTGLERYSFRTNLDQKINDRFKMGTKIDGSFSNVDDRPNDAMYYTNPFWGAHNILPWDLPYTEDGQWSESIPSMQNVNFLRDNALNEQSRKDYKANGNIYAQIEIIPGLTFKTVGALEFYYSENTRWWDPRYNTGEGGTLQLSQIKLQRTTNTNTLSYTKTLSDVHNISVLVGHESFKQTWQRLYQQGQELGYQLPYLSTSTKETSTVGYGFSEYTLLSYFGILNYNYDGKYYLSASVRRDGNSKFGADKRWGTFWSVGGSWNAHEESFLEGLSFINQAKLRASYGVNGNDGIGVYDQYGVYASGSYNGMSMLFPSTIETPALGWELNTQWNIGVDFAIFRDITGTIEYYNRTTSEMLLDVPLSATSGFGEIQSNIGELVNRGLEIELGYKILSGDIDWDVNGNFSMNNVELTDLAGEDVISNTFWYSHRLGGGFADYHVYDYAGVNPATGYALWYDENGNISESYSDANRVYRGQIEPSYMGGISTSASWKGITLSASFEFRAGNYVYCQEKRYTAADGYNWNSNQSNELLDYWKQPGDITGTPKPLVNNGTNSNAWGTSRFLQRGDFLRFKDLTVSYNIPKNIVEKIKLDKARIYFSGVNLYTWHDVNYFDPEREFDGGSYVAFPMAKTFTFGLEVGF